MTIGLAVFAGRFRYVEVLFLRTTMVAIFVLSGGTTWFKGVGKRAAPAFEFPVRNIFTVGAKRFVAKKTWPSRQDQRGRVSSPRCCAWFRTSREMVGWTRCRTS